MYKNKHLNSSERKILRRILNTIDKADLKQVLKETITLSRIKCDGLIQNVSSYFIENKNLFIEMDYYPVSFCYNFLNLI